MTLAPALTSFAGKTCPFTGSDGGIPAAIADHFDMIATYTISDDGGSVLRM